MCIYLSGGDMVCGLPAQSAEKSRGTAADDIRLEMVRLALGDYDQLIPSDVEFHMPRPSYTIDTLDALTQAYPDRHFSLIIGSRQLVGD